MIMRQAFLLAFAGLCVSVFGGTNSTSGNNGNGNGNGGNSGNGNGSSNAGGNGNGNSNGKAGGNGNGNSARNSTGNGNSKKVLAVGEACNPADKLCHAPAKCEPLPSVPSNGICAEGVSIPDKYTCTWNVNTTIPWGDEQLAWCCVNHGVRCPGPEAIDLSKTKEECLATAATADRSACCDSSGVLCESKCYSNTTALNTGQAMQCCRQHGLYCSVNCAGAAQLTGNEKHYCCAVNGLYCSEDQAFEQAEAALREAFDKSKAGKAQGTFLLKVKGQAQEVLANPRQLMLRARLALILASPQLHGDPSRLLMTRVGVLLANGEVPSLNKTGWSVETPVTWQTGDVFDNEKKVAAMQRGNKPGSGAKLDMSVNAAKPDSGAKPGKSAAKPDSGAKPDKSAAKPDSGAKPGKSAAKPDSGAKPDKSAAKPDSGAKPDKSAAKPDSGAKPDKSAAKPDSGARTDKSADKSDSGAKSDDKDDTSEEKDSSRFFEVLASDAIEGLFIEYAVYDSTNDGLKDIQTTIDATIEEKGFLTGGGVTQALVPMSPPVVVAEQGAALKRDGVSSMWVVAFAVAASSLLCCGLLVAAVFKKRQTRDKDSNVSINDYGRVMEDMSRTFLNGDDDDDTGFVCGYVQATQGTQQESHRVIETGDL